MWPLFSYNKKLPGNNLKRCIKNTILMKAGWVIKSNLAEPNRNYRRLRTNCHGNSLKDISPLSSWILGFSQTLYTDMTLQNVHDILSMTNVFYTSLFHVFLCLIVKVFLKLTFLSNTEMMSLTYCHEVMKMEAEDNTHSLPGQLWIFIFMQSVINTL